MITGEINGKFEESPAKVFDFVTDLEAEPEWNPDVKTIKRLSGNNGQAGAKYEGNYKGMGRMDIEVVDSHRPDDVSFVCTGDKLDMKINFSFKSDGAGTLLHATAEMTPKGLMKYLTPIMRGQIKKTFDNRPKQMAAGLKKYTWSE
jgi:hypothetical protein